MKNAMRFLAVALIAGGTMFAQTRFSIGIGIGRPVAGAYPPPAYAQQYVPPCPGPDYTWVDGYWDGGVWTNGFWRAPYVTGYRVAPRYYETYRHFDRDDFRRYDRDGHRGYDRGFRGNEHHEDRGRDFGRGFRR